MTAPQPGLLPEYAGGVREGMLQGLARELEIRRGSPPSPTLSVTTALTLRLAARGNSPGISLRATSR